jgi:hypothetical protein
MVLRRPVFVMGKVVPFPFDIPLIVLLFPLFLIFALISLPATAMHFALQRWSEGRFAAKLRSAGRTISWDEARSLVEQGRGFFIAEYLSTNALHRLWWTPDDVPALSPFPCCFEDYPDFFLDVAGPFHVWCRVSYTDVGSGSALWVDRSSAELGECSGAIERLRLLRRTLTTGSRFPA